MSTDPLFSIFYDWEISTLGDIVARGGGSIQTGPFGSQLHASDYVDHGIPSIMPQNIANDRISEEGIARITEEDAKRLSKYRVRKGDIIYSRRGDVERRALVRQEHDGWLCGTGCLKVSFGHGLVVPEYAAFYLSHPASRSWVVQHAVGATMPNLNTSILSALPFVLPPISEQKRIAGALCPLDDKIELNRRMNETLEEMARALFRDWFIDFGPTRRQMDGATDPAAIMGHAFPDNKASALAPLFPARLGDNGAPDDWGLRNLKSLGHIITGKTPSTKEPKYYGSDVPFLKIPDMHGKIYVLETGTMLSSEGAASQEKKTLPKGSVSVSCIATPGLVVLNHRETQTNQQINSIVPFVDKHRYFVFWSCRELAAEVMVRGSGGSVFHNMNKTTFENLDVIFPGDKLASMIRSAVEPLHMKILVNEEENQTLTQIRDLLLPKLMSGEIQLKDKPIIQDTLDGQPIKSSQLATLKHKPGKMRILKMNPSGSVKN